MEKYKYHKNSKEKSYAHSSFSIYHEDKKEEELFKKFKEKVKKSEYRFLSNFFNYQIYKFLEEK